MASQKESTGNANGLPRRMAWLQKGRSGNPGGGSNAIAALSSCCWNRSTDEGEKNSLRNSLTEGNLETLATAGIFIFR